MAWEKAVSVEELPENSRKVVQMGGTKILVLNEKGSIYAVGSRCPHLNLKISRGKITSDGSIVCPFHRSAFDLSTGQAKEWTPWPPVVGKAMAAVSKPKDLPTYATKVESGSIFVEV
jgi:nitrite reductase/ring-hydroxylating ferredoxin subunit